MTAFQTIIHDILNDPDSPDEAKVGAVAMASLVLDKAILDPAAREAWLALRDGVIEPWVQSTIARNAATDGDSETTFLAPSDGGMTDSGDHKSISLSAASDLIKIGKLQTSTVVFDHEDVARMHATIEREPAGWRVLDLGGRVGVRVHRPDGEVEVVLRDAPVEPGDILQFGSCSLELLP